jgi:hypothetical protein
MKPIAIYIRNLAFLAARTSTILSRRDAPQPPSSLHSIRNEAKKIVSKNAEAAARKLTHIILETSKQEVANGFDLLRKSINVCSNKSPEATILKTLLMRDGREFGVELPFSGFCYEYNRYNRRSCLERIMGRREMTHVVVGIDLVFCIEEGVLMYEEALLSRILKKFHVRFSVKVLEVEHGSE